MILNRMRFRSIVSIRLLTGIILFVSLIVYCQEVDTNSKPVIIVGDTQRSSKWEFILEQNEGVPKKIFDKIADENPSFIIHLGDISFWGSSDSWWSYFDEDAAEVIKRSIPIYPVPGNHDYFGSNKAAKINIVSRFPFLKERTWYTKRINNLGIIFLNSNLGDLTGEENNAQLRFYKNELKTMGQDSSIHHIIVVCHHSPYTNSTIVDPSKGVQKYFVPAFMKAVKTKAFLTGHCHSIEHFIKSNKHFIVSGGGGGPRQQLATGKRAKYKDYFTAGSIRYFNYCRLTFEESTLKLEVLGWDDSITNCANLFTLEFKQ
jgi:Icc-related predicted phosphoesterase